MLTTLHWIPLTEPGALAISARPRGGDGLQEDLKAWQGVGVQTVVSALELDEEIYLDMDSEPDLCARLGLSFVRFKVSDRGVPSLDSSSCEFVNGLAARIRDGERIAVHCRMGIGRSGLLCAAILVALGFDADEAFLRVESARGLRVPDTR